jgi:hypothetical protein
MTKRSRRNDLNCLFQRETLQATGSAIPAGLVNRGIFSSIKSRGGNYFLRRRLAVDLPGSVEDPAEFGAFSLKG